jgi:hypothetical protein
MVWTDPLTVVVATVSHELARPQYLVLLEHSRACQLVGWVASLVRRAVPLTPGPPANCG